MQEIERKFLVNNDDYKLESSHFYHIIQGYLNRDIDRTVRVRIKNAVGLITIKGRPNDSGTTRFEWEKEITLEEAKALLELAEEGVIEKIRYVIDIGDSLFFEVDEFLGEQEGLVLAEIELPSPDTDFVKPDWLGDEVTGNAEYYNSSMHHSRNKSK